MLVVSRRLRQPVHSIRPLTRYSISSSSSSTSLAPAPWIHLRHLRPVRLQQRHFTALTTTTSLEVEGCTSEKEHRTLQIDSDARENAIGIQQLSTNLHKQIFGGAIQHPPPELVNLAKDHLARHNLGESTDKSRPIGFDLPKLQGKTLDEHFYRLGQNASKPYIDIAEDFAKFNCPEPPTNWVKRSGWTKYMLGKEPVAVDYPEDDALVFDVEVLWKISPFPVVACAVGKTAWYAWISPWVLNEGEPVTDRHLISVGPSDKDRVIIGHNVGYDRARIKEEYHVVQSKNCFIDTMSLHVAVNGMCSRQRPTWLKHRKNRELREKIANETNSEELAKLLQNAPDEMEQELWVGRSSINSLRDVAQFHCKIAIDKTMRDTLGEMDVEMLSKRLNETLDYCAADVIITHKVYKKVLPAFREVCPHPVSFAALRHMSSVILPVNQTWKEYIQRAEGTYEVLLENVQEHLRKLAEEALTLKDKPEIYENDPWLRQLDWSGQEIRYTKSGKIAARQKLPGMPKWYKDLFPKADGDMNLSVRTRIAPLLLRLTWSTYPLVWTDKYGWAFRVPADSEEAWAFQDKNLKQCTELAEEKPHISTDSNAVYYKLPHKDGHAARCATPLAKTYQRYFEDKTLDSQYEIAKKALDMNAACSYWISARERIKSQTVIWENDVDLGLEKSDISNHRLGIILPQLIPMGTITRRAVEATWLTASNAKKTRVGSELKSMIKAPPGYHFVGADVDSEELWIASLVGDSQFKMHGGNAIGFMTLEGTKKAGTDMHSRTASVLGISRNDAKIFNYGRIYGAGLKFAGSLLRQFNPSIKESEAAQTAANLYEVTKGLQTSRRILSNRKFWRGGTESFVFNKLEEFAEQETPRTPVLGAGITEALQKRYINKGSFMTSRINWAIQSSGVDYLHLLVISMDYLIKCYQIDARLMLTVHDEIRYLVKTEDRYRAAMALQVSNLWTRAMFAQQMGINDLPQSVAFFSAVDIDHVLRKEVDLDCVTPSNPDPIPHGESVDIVSLLEKGEESCLDPELFQRNKPDLSKIEYEQRPTVMSQLESDSNILFLRAQITKNNKELQEIVQEAREVQAKRSSMKRLSSKSDSSTAPNFKPQDLELTQLTLTRDWSQRSAFPRSKIPISHKPFTRSAPKI